MTTSSVRHIHLINLSENSRRDIIILWNDGGIVFLKFIDGIFTIEAYRNQLYFKLKQNC